MNIAVHEHALKHGLTEDDIVHAWRNAYATGWRIRDNGAIDILAVGVASSGKNVEMVARKFDSLLLIFHANTPISKRMTEELNL